MYTYQFICSNPEGIEFIYDMVHEKLFSESEFEKLCTDSLLKYYKQQMLPKTPTDIPYVSRSPGIIEFWSYFEKLGFKTASLPTAVFSIDPWSGSENSDLEKCFEEVKAFNSVALGLTQILRREQWRQKK